MRGHNENSEIELICTLVFLLQFAWLLDPHAYLEHPPHYKMYPFSDQLISRPAWVDYGFRDVSYMLLFYLMTKFIPGMSARLQVFFWLWLGYFIDYLVCYNEPFYRLPIQFFAVRLFAIPLSYSLFAGLLMIYITLRDILKK